jgi:hypothetical protein
MRRLPVPIPTDQLQGLLDRTGGPMAKLIVALIAIHGLGKKETTHLLVNDLDLSAGRLLVRRPTGPHTVYFDQLTHTLAIGWLRERHHRWPLTTSTRLLVTGNPLEVWRLPLTGFCNFHWLILSNTSSFFIGVRGRGAWVPSRAPGGAGPGLPALPASRGRRGLRGPGQPAGLSRAARCAAPLRPEERPRTLRGEPGRQRRRSRLLLIPWGPRSGPAALTRPPGPWRQRPAPRRPGASCRRPSAAGRCCSPRSRPRSPPGPAPWSRT